MRRKVQKRYTGPKPPYPDYPLSPKSTPIICLNRSLWRVLTPIMPVSFFRAYIRLLCLMGVAMRCVGLRGVASDLVHFGYS